MEVKLVKIHLHSTICAILQVHWLCDAIVIPLFFEFIEQGEQKVQTALLYLGFAQSTRE